MAVNNKQIREQCDEMSSGWEQSLDTEFNGFRKAGFDTDRIAARTIEDEIDGDEAAVKAKKKRRDDMYRKLDADRVKIKYSARTQRKSLARKAHAVLSHHPVSAHPIFDFQLDSCISHAKPLPAGQSRAGPADESALAGQARAHACAGPRLRRTIRYTMPATMPATTT